MKTFADSIIGFNKSLKFTGRLPEGINVMNPFTDDYIMQVSSAFYRKFYSDTKRRHLILGINPGRFGAGVTGIPFTDTKRLTNECGLKYSGKETHEPSSVFVYEVIKAYGGTEKFYSDFYIGAVSPLGFTISDSKGREKNYNYYDSKELTLAVNDFALLSLKRQLDFGIERDICFCFGSGKNEKYLRSLNHDHGFFREIIALEHPRFIMQYRSRSREQYIAKYLEAFDRVTAL